MFDKEYFRLHLRDLRKARGNSIEEVADAIGVKRPTVNRYETGTILPSISALWRLADYFDVSLDELVGRKH